MRVGIQESVPTVLEHAQSENGAFFFRAIPESEVHYESLAKTRRISRIYHLTTGDRAANRYSFALNSDLEIEAEWSTDHILEVAEPCF